MTITLPRVELGTTGLAISRFILGTGALGGMAAVTGPGIGLDESASADLLTEARDLGITLLDTSDIYARGESERILGRWLAQNPDSGFLVQTKTGITPDGPDLSPGRIRAQLDRARQTLGRIDLFLAHTVDPGTPWSESLPVFSQAVDDGEVTAYGVSNVTEADLSEVLETADRLSLRRPSIVQNRYSLLSRDDDAGVLPLARSESLAYTPYSPLAAGLLAGRYTQGEAPAHGSRISTQQPALGVLDDAATHDRIGRFTALAEQTGVTAAALAFAWLLHQPGVTAPIVGVTRSSHWDAVTESRGVPWSEDLGRSVDEIFPGPGGGV
jgi:aryl-alcohol dehydrogenase-like predicted oxidoreductase